MPDLSTIAPDFHPLDADTIISEAERRRRRIRPPLLAASIAVAAGVLGAGAVLSLGVGRSGAPAAVPGGPASASAVTAPSASSSLPPSTRPTQPEPPLGPVSSLLRPEDARRPIDAYRLTPADVRQLAAIETRLANECRTRRGAPADVTVRGDLDGWSNDHVASETRDSPLWGMFSPTMADQGYLLRTPLVHAMGGSVAGHEQTSAQCDDAARAQMPDQMHWKATSATSAWPSGGPDTPLRDSRWLAAAESWRRCMQGQGFAVADPVAARSPYTTVIVLDSRGQAVEVPRQVTDAERSQAAADLACKTETNLVGVGVAVQAAYDQRYLDQNRAALEAWRAKVGQFIATHQ